MSVIEHIVAVFERVGTIAAGLRSRLAYFLGFALLASVYLAIKLYSADSALWWNIIKCGVFMIPALIWGIVWFVLGKLRDAPDVANDLIADKDEMLQHFSGLDIKQVTTVRGAFSTLKVLREQEGLEEVMETIGGVGLLINPLFVICMVLAFFALIVSILAALVLLLF